YISFTSALSFYQITTQVQHGWYENAAQKRSKKIDGPGVCFVYFKIQPRLFFGYTRRNGCFLAEPEKALLDAAYLAWVGRYSLDWDALDVGRLDHGRLSEMAASFPEAIQQKVNARCRI
ncbi:MAG: hypothetical protein ACLFUP_08445, partial [Desulfobacteraceae bacterium]